jgi:hypothetical protein
MTHVQSAGIAQSVEQRTENPRVTSSSLVPGIPTESTFSPLIKLFQLQEEKDTTQLLGQFRLV